MKTLMILVSYHHNNTQKIAETFAKALEAQIKSPQQTNPQELQEVDLTGFGSGIYFGKHHKDLLELVEKLPQMNGKKAFIFSTSGDTRNPSKLHNTLRDSLNAKGYTIVDEFNCPGYDTYGALKLLGGIKKGKPDGEDLKHAEEFAQNLKTK
jgi:flavodoxin